MQKDLTLSATATAYVTGHDWSHTSKMTGHDWSLTTGCPKKNGDLERF